MPAGKKARIFTSARRWCGASYGGTEIREHEVWTNDRHMLAAAA